MSEYQIHATRLSVIPKGEPFYSERATHLEIEDEAAGCFVAIKQEATNDDRRILIDPQEWPTIKEAIERMFATCAAIDGGKP